MAFVRSRGVDVHYVAYGASRVWAERTVVVLHGYTLDHRSAVATFEPAFHGRAGWRRLYLDFPGMGRTRAPEWVASTDDVLDVTSGAVDGSSTGRTPRPGSRTAGTSLQVWPQPPPTG